MSDLEQSDAPELALPRGARSGLPGAGPPHRRPLDRDTIVQAGLAYIDDAGMAGLTMRRLGGRLGVEAMALYRHVPSKEDLLDAIVEAMVDEMRADEQVLDSPVHGWQDFLQRLAHGVRRVALAHPRAFPLVASRPPEAPWLRPPLRSLAWVETFLGGLKASGFSDESAVGAYRAFTSFLLGHLLLEAAVHGAEISPLDTAAGSAPHEPEAPESPDSAEAALGRYPHVLRLSGMLAEDQAAVEFEESLENLLDRIGLMAAEDT